MQTNQNNIDVTVVIPAYNSEKVIARALDSVFAQTVQPQKIIVIDDGSTDNTGDVVRKYSNILYVVQKNAGPAAARNHGIKLANTEWIAFLDSDDYWYPERLQCQWEIISKNPKLMWCSGLLAVNKAGKEMELPIVQSVVKKVKQSGFINVYDLTMSGYHLHLNNLLINRSVFDKVGVFDESVTLGEDRDLWWRISLQYPDIGFCLKKCSEYCIDTPNSALKQTVDRTPSLSVIVKNYLRYTGSSETIDPRFVSYLRKLGISYILREASGKINIEKHLIKESKGVIKLGPYYSSILLLAKILPRRVSYKIISRLEPRVG